MKSTKKNYRKNKIKKDIQIDRPLPIKRLRTILFCAITILLLLLIRIFWIQFINGAWLKEKAFRQQTASKIISPERGSILDVNGKILATSEKVDTISINPGRIKDENKELVAKGLSDIFELDYNEILEKVNSTSSSQTIIKKVEKDKVSELETWMSNNKITTGINIDEDNKRCYPYNEIASQVIGFCGTDNQGLEGIELSFENILTGRSGKIVTTIDLNNSEISDNHATYVEAQNGSDVYLTLDINIQSIVEKYIKKTVDNNQCESASSIIMEPSTGNILAMASYPNYNLNTPFEPSTTEAKENWDKMTADEKSAFLNHMWRDKNIEDTYEPGSTFKTLVSAIALEENITETNTSKDFYCKGYETINGRKIRCWSSKPHGYQTLTEALANSCNPAFMQLGDRVGIDIYYKYFEAFGLFNKTGISLPGESISIFHDKNSVNASNIATMSFGQRFKVTPLQLITAVSSLANGGILVKPQIVSKTVNNDTGAVSSTETEQIRQVVSKETADNVIDMMEYVVSNGTGKKGSVKGYTIAGKTGTSESIAGSDEGNTLSYIAVAPSENPSFVALVVLYNTPTTQAQGSTVAGPVISNILSETLPYLGVTSDEANIKNSNTNSIAVPNVVNKTVTEAEKILKNAGFDAIITCSDDKNSTLVTTQVPSNETKLLKDSVVLLYTEKNSTRTSVTVPNLKGMSLTSAKSALKKKNLNISYSGTGTVSKQSIKQGIAVEEGTIIEVTLSY